MAEVVQHVPSFLNSEEFGIISPYDVAAILQGGCNSGAWMPAVTYSTATKILDKHEDEILNLIEGCGPFSFDPGKDSLGGFRCKLVSCAVEAWCSAVESLLEESLEAIQPEIQ